MAGPVLLETIVEAMIHEWCFFFFQAEDGIRDLTVTGVQTCALPIFSRTADYPRWWSWLRAVEVDGLREGATARCLVRAPVPFELRFAVTVRRLVRPDRKSVV